MILPDGDDNVLEFKNHCHKESDPSAIYADLECILASQRNKTEIHIPHSAAYYFHCAL